MGALTRSDGKEIYAAARAAAQTLGMVREGWNGFNVLHHAAGRVGAMEVGFVPQAGGKDMGGIIAAAKNDGVRRCLFTGCG